MKQFKGVVKARVVSARFAVSGKIVSLKKHTGDSVKKGEILASLDTKILQTGLDRQLADYEKVRADFEIFSQKYPDPTEAIDKYLKTEKQASLNASVKDVELAKWVLDQTVLFSPVDGVVIDDGSLVAGIYTTPAGSEIKIIDNSSYFFEIEVGEKDVSYFTETNPSSHKATEGRRFKVEITGIKKAIEGEGTSVISDGKKFLVRIPLPYSEGLLLGLSGKAFL